MTDMVKREDMTPAPESGEMSVQAQNAPDIQQISALVRDMMMPVMESIARMLQNNTQAMEQIAAAQQITSERIACLEKRVRLQTPLSKSQENCINGAIRARARELLDARGFSEDKKAVTKLCGIIRRSVLARYGVGSLREAPAYDYETAMKQVGMWNDRIAIRDVEKEARAREEADLQPAEPSAGMDGAPAYAGMPDQSGELAVPGIEETGDACMKYDNAGGA